MNRVVTYKDFGYIAFAASPYGNPFLFDLNKISDGKPRIVSASHEYSYESAEEARENVVHVAESIEEFLSMVADKTIKN